jgi:glutamate carboxypeptidase
MPSRSTPPGDARGAGKAFICWRRRRPVPRHSQCGEVQLVATTSFGYWREGADMRVGDLARVSRYHVPGGGPDLSEVREYLADCREAMVHTLEQLVRLESPSLDAEAVNAVGDYLAGRFTTLGAQVERFRRAGYGDHLRVTWGQGAPQVLLLGHMDTVWPVGEVERRPFRIVPSEQAGVLAAQGPGIFDMKGGLVIGLYALAALHETGLPAVPRVVFLLNSDEEVGSPTSRSLIEQEAQRSQAVLVLEPSREGALVTWRKGVGRFELEIHGLASHSGAAHDRGVSAVEELAHQVLALERMTDYERGTTVNVGTVHGGSRVNVRPALARASIDLRVTSAQEGRRMERAILGLSPVNARARLSVSGGINRPPWQATSQGNALFERAKRLGAGLGMELWPAGTGGGSDGNFTAALGVPTLDGLGVVGDDAHAVTEWADLNSLPSRAALLAELMRELVT